MFSVLFGLSTDYEVYLVSRIQEEWRLRSHDTDPRHGSQHAQAVRRNHQAITTGQAKSGKIIAGAALIMVLVFGSFLLSGDRILQEFGFGLGFAVLVDALIIRSLLVPAIMHRIGPANWAMPAWLDRIVPNLSIETAEPPDDRPDHAREPADRATSAEARATSPTRCAPPQRSSAGARASRERHMTVTSILIYVASDRLHRLPEGSGPARQGSPESCSCCPVVLIVLGYVDITQGAGLRFA